MNEPDYIATRCAICQTNANSTVIYEARIDQDTFCPGSYSARRPPDRRHFRIVRCRSCGLLRSDPIIEPTSIARLYRASSFDYGSEVENIGRTYSKYLTKLLHHCPSSSSLLEIGCGNGFFLELARKNGFRKIRGIEPSQAAVDQAAPQIKPFIVNEMMDRNLFEQNSFDLICMFQVLDHFVDPQSLLDECYRLLKPDGAMLCINHDAEAFSVKILRERSPIFDIEHTYLYDRQTMNRLFSQSAFFVYKTGPVIDTFSFDYLVHLAPIPEKLRTKVHSVSKRFQIGRMPVSLPFGNLYLIAGKKRKRKTKQS